MSNPSTLPLSFEDMMTRMIARDRSADGHFITGVLTTGIYCLPSCPARKPKAENVVFFATEAEAQAAGLRACKRCHPDAFYAGRDPDRERLTAVLSAMDLDPAAVPDVTALADRMGVGLSKLHALTQRCAGTTPGELIHTSRVRGAMRLLRQGDIGATEAGFAVGYGSVSAFYERFKQTTGSTPKAFASRAASGVD